MPYRVVVAAILLVALLGCRQSRPREVVVQVPGLNGAPCAERIREALAQTDGVNLATVQFDYERQQVTVGFDSMNVATKNIEHAIAGAGFDANSIPADAAARANLPPECR